MTAFPPTTLDMSVASPGARLGSRYLGNEKTEFFVWAPRAQKLEVEIIGGARVPLEKQEYGYFRGTVQKAAPGQRYWYWLDGSKRRADPASRFQPEGVSGPSEIISDDFSWTDQAWTGLPLENYLIYEVHIGTFTKEGTFESAIERIPSLVQLGVTALEIMPISQFPGGRNWGYDGVSPFAAQNTYGGPAGLKKLVNACHNAGIAVILDVVYNHMGPEGNYLSDFGPYFTDRYKTPWGWSLNYDEAENDHVRRFFLESARVWISDFRIDALRVDAVHAIFDFSARPFLQELCDMTRALSERLKRRVFSIAESDLNDSRVIRPASQKGWGFDAQWADDFHHALHVLLTDDRGGYYEDFEGVTHMKKALLGGYSYAGDYSRYRRRRHGDSAADLDAGKFVFFSQNHDQIGNRMKGERLCHLVGFDRQKLAAAAVLMSPSIPLLFMGEEYGETAPFQYFISHEDPELVKAVQKGRRDEFSSFGWKGEVPDPASEETFAQCRLTPGLREKEPHRTLWAFYRRLIALRRDLPALKPGRDGMKVEAQEELKTLTLDKERDSSRIFCAFNFSQDPRQFALPPGPWKKILDSEDREWGGGGSEIPVEPISGFLSRPLSFVLFSKGT